MQHNCSQQDMRKICCEVCGKVFLVHIHGHLKWYPLSATRQSMWGWGAWSCCCSYLVNHEGKGPRHYQTLRMENRNMEGPWVLDDIIYPLNLTTLELPCLWNYYCVEYTSYSSNNLHLVFYYLQPRSKQPINCTSKKRIMEVGVGEMNWWCL